MSTEQDPRRLERGQVLALVALALIVVLGIGALVVDLGLSWMMRRHEQNGADPGAVAAARYLRPTADVSKMNTAACFYARQNGFFPYTNNNSGCVPANDPDRATLTVNYPPAGVSAGLYAGRQDAVQVTITAQHPNFLGALFGQPTATVSATAVAVFSNGDSNSNSLIALDPTNDCKTGWVTGSGSVTIQPVIDPSTGLPYNGGYVQVNSTCGTGPVNDLCDVTSSGGLVVDSSNGTLIAPHVFVTGTCKKTNSNPFSSPLTEGALQLGDPLAELEPPRISDYPAWYCPATGQLTSPTGPNSQGCQFKNAGTVVLNPGVYYGGWDIRNNVTLQLNPGIYMMAGGGVKLNAGGSITSVIGGSGPAPVLIFSTDNPAAICPGGTSYQCQGGLDFSAQSTLALAGMASGPYRGLLIWQDGNGSCATNDPTCKITLGGQTALTIAGTIYAPRELVILDGGSSATGIAAIQIIAWQWEITGGGTLLMPYDPNKLYHLDQKGLVH